MGVSQILEIAEDRLPFAEHALDQLGLRLPRGQEQGFYLPEPLRDAWSDR
ncbi:hypothetical protein PV682_43740 [Streptomyces niveiscabiei]|nr:hypothetical protein [Streptomyces niveiscabiei]MDX3388302.1 hypothetical protein [Streptomyces niveiscabiei]